MSSSERQSRVNGGSIKWSSISLRNIICISSLMVQLSLFLCQLLCETAHPYCHCSHQPPNNHGLLLHLGYCHSHVMGFFAILHVFICLNKLHDKGASSNIPSSMNNTHGVVSPMVFSFSNFNMLYHQCDSSCWHTACKKYNSWQNHLPSHFLK